MDNGPKLSKNETGQQEPRSSSTGGKLSKNQRSQLEKRIKQIEGQIPRLEAEAGHLTRELAMPQIASDYPKLAEISGKLRETETRIKALYEEWELAAERLG